MSKTTRTRLYREKPLVKSYRPEIRRPKRVEPVAELPAFRCLEGEVPSEHVCRGWLGDKLFHGVCQHECAARAIFYKKKESA